MYHIAIWDDEEDALERIGYLCKQVMEKLGQTFTIDSFVSVEELLEAQKAGSRWHLILLDIFMEEPVGLTLAKKIRKLDADIDIVFITNCMEYALDGYDSFPVGYLLKPLSLEKLSPVIERCVAKHKKEKTVTFRLKENKMKNVPIKNILWIEIFKKELIVHCKEGDLLGIGSLLETLNQLPPQFFRCHRSFIVNLDAVTGVQKYEFILTNKQIVPIAMRNFPQAQQLWLSHLQW